MTTRWSPEHAGSAGMGVTDTSSSLCPWICSPIEITVPVKCYRLVAQPVPWREPQPGVAPLHPCVELAGCHLHRDIIHAVG